MKIKSIVVLVAFVLLSFSNVKAQEPVYEFCLVTCYEKLNWLAFELYVIGRVEYGETVQWIQENKADKYPEDKKTAYKNSKRFPSVISIFNYMSADGWEYVEAVLVSEPSGGSVYRWLLKRPVKK